METLINLLKKVLSDTFTFYVKAHSFHWNVEGANFPQYHEFFGTVYKELHDAVDIIAEQIRALDSYAPGTMAEFLELTDIQEESEKLTAVEMSSKLNEDNNKLVNTLELCDKLANQFEQIGLSNFLQDRIDKHKKLGWMLRSVAKNV